MLNNSHFYSKFETIIFLVFGAKTKKILFFKSLKLQRGILQV